ncbi:MAG: AAA family ATPase, partial [Nostoc sp.]
MSNTSPASGFWNYVAECVRLLYWSYFKPFTFERWLREIHPELKPTDNPFDKRAEFCSNPRLRRYAGQVWWLTAVVPIVAVFPIVAVLLVAPVYTVISGESFNWLLSCVFLVGWFIGRVLECGANKNKLV